ncbi:hypothetical protein CAI21_08595 [Alkalilimnicola ehrlichii]|uniref:Intracellular growth attenuator IgaA n=1 Tax=Alkalilimnicola ehrlichii TaxID=351052 RepID=A0A3E0WWB1_9GAMM|nr:IgaA/UmoB family intracellular growth attenuator [Alkalilimnicola ehrlichii]RFA29882.1 hypothetical protein CAI21_08595 [Alkalilimnicola ehrlichii]RFA36473.1 hypothetical protein CAL65_10875 [Alkalilimnicola ehrlichii]
MATLQLILFAIIIVSSIVSLISYYSRRADNKAAMRELRQDGQAIRLLDKEERACIEALDNESLSPVPTVELLADSVFRIEGPYLRHGISGGNGGETMHDTIGGVEVVLPYDATVFLAPHNVAEVVLTPKFALVVRLNDAFDIRGGYARAQAERKRQERWTSGDTGALSVAESAAADAQAHAAPESSADNTKAEHPEAQAIESAQVLGQREETPAEAAARNHPGYGILAALAMLASFISLLIAGNSLSPWPWVIASVALLVLGQWLLLRRRKAKPPQPVNHVRGKLTLLEWRNPSDNTQRWQLYVGSDLPVTLPKHWAPFFTAKSDATVDLDVRVDDQTIVRYGNTLSLDNETRHFPPIHWGKHLLLALTGCLMVAIALINNDQIRLDTAHVQAALLNGEPQTLTDPERVLAQPPSPGTMVRLQGEVRCQLPQDDHDGLREVSCRQVRWGAPAPQVADVELDPELVRLYNGELLSTQRDRRLELMVQMEAIRSGNHRGGTTEVHRLNNLGELILAIDRECTSRTSGSARACGQLRNLLLSNVAFFGDTPAPDNWNALVEYARSEQLHSGAANRSTVRNLRSHLEQLGAAQMTAQYTPHLRDANRSQQGGVVLPLAPADAEILRYSAPQNYVQAVFPSANANSDLTPWEVQWRAYQALSGDEGLWPLDLTGLVTGHRSDNNGGLILEVTAERVPENVLPAALRLAALLMGMLVLAIHGALWLLKFARAEKRKQAIDAHYAALPR